MANSVEALNRAYNAVAGTVTHMSLHTGDPGSTGASEVTGGSYARVAQSYGAPTSGAGDLAAPAVFDVPEGTTVTHWGAWDNTTFLFGESLEQSQSFATAGTYTLTSAPYSATNPS